jgi:hypothetical protein
MNSPNRNPLRNKLILDELIVSATVERECLDAVGEQILTLGLIWL